MDPITKALLLSWDVRFEILLPLTLLGAFQFIGWQRLRRRGAGRFATGWRLASYLTGLIVLILALLSPIDVLASQLFSLHMIQHLLLVMVAPPLLWLAGPFATGLWALPRPLRLQVGGWFQHESRFREFLRLVTQPGLSWLLFVGTLFLWHDPNAYSLAQGNSWIHDLEHLTFFGTAMLFWWRVIGSGPHIHGRSSLLSRIGYVMGVVPANMLLGVTLSLAESPIYPYYLDSGHDDVYRCRLDSGGPALYQRRSPPRSVQGRRGEACPAHAPSATTGNHRMTKMRRTGVLFLLIILPLLCSGRSALAHAGVGTQQINNQDIGPYRIWVWSDPEPPVVGNYHVAVALTESLDNDPNGFAGESILNADVVVEMEHQASGLQLIAQATHEDAVNKLFYEAIFAPQQTGTWEIRVIVQGPDGPVQTSYSDEIESPAFPWMAVGGGLLALALAGAGTVLYLKTGEKDVAQKPRPSR
jgi:putative membrane protein